MSGAGDYRGSQAYAQNQDTEEHVNQNTGSLSYSRTLIALSGINPSIDVSIDISYESGTAGAYGLPQGWGLGIETLIPYQSLTSQGKTYSIDLDWADDHKYKSGLHYVNDHGIELKVFVPSLPLPGGLQPLPPSFQGSTYAWRLTQNDGSRSYFDALGKVRQHSDRYGNSIYYSFANNNAPLNQTVLSYIVDSWGQMIQFQYPNNQQMFITGPDRGVTKITFSTKGVLNIVDPMNNQTQFRYVTFESKSVLDTIAYPTGLNTNFTYQPIKYLDSAGNSQVLPAVLDHYHKSYDNSTILSHTNYAFGSATDNNTFTGYSQHYRMGGSHDSLVDSQNVLYFYDVLVRRYGSNGRCAAASQTTYNYLHLPQFEYHFSVDSNGAISPGNQTVYTYLVDANPQIRKPSYTLPITVEQLQYDASANTYRQRRLSSVTYDYYNNVLTMSEQIWDADQQAYLLLNTLQSSYTETPWQGELLTNQIIVDNVSKLQRAISYDLTTDKNSIENITIQYQTATDTQLQPWKTKSFVYDANGRITSDKTSWSNSSLAPPGSPLTSTYTTTYNYVTPNDYYEATTTDPGQNKFSSTISTSVMHGPILSKTLPGGQSESFQYDLNGQLTQYTDPFQHRINLTYVVSPSSNTMTMTGPQNYTVQKVYDAMGRLLQVLDNGDTTQPASSSPNRVLSSTSYDTLSRVTSLTDQYGVKTTYDVYDAFNRLLQSTDTFSNIKKFTYDDVAQTRLCTINDQQREQNYFDALGREVQRISFPDSGDTNIDYNILQSSVYDGMGQILQTTVAKQSLKDSSSVVWTTVSNIYNAESAISTESRCGINSSDASSKDKITRTFTYDLFGNTFSSSKQVTYANGTQTTINGFSDVFDQSGLLQTHTLRNGQQEKFTYDTNGYIKSMTRFDGQKTINFTSDAIGRIMTIDGDDAVTQAFTPSGQLSSVTKQNTATSFQYNLDGSLSQVNYPGDRKQNYDLDKYSRIVQLTDANGVLHSTSFDNYGRVNTRACADTTLTYQYDTVNHCMGQLTGNTSDGNGGLTQTFMFDGFGRKSQVTTKTSSGETVLEVATAYDVLGRAASVQLSSTLYPSVPQLNFTQTFVYDGLGQLVNDTVTYANTGQASSPIVTSYVYDGNTNILNRTVNGKPENFTYNELDQRTDGEFVYDSNGRLTSDSQVSSYNYLDDDRLLAVKLQIGSGVGFNYYPNGALAGTVTSEGSTTLFYDGGAINTAQQAYQNTNSSVSFLIEPGRRVLAHQATPSSDVRYVDALGSIVHTQTDDQGGSSIQYNAYGEPNPHDEGALLTNAFGYKQQFTESTSGLVYLRARYYNPSNASFITMDSSHKENGYAFCQGDPVNLSDDTGHGVTREEVGLAAGIVVGLAVSILSGFTLSWAAAGILAYGTEATVAASLTVVETSAGMNAAIYAVAGAAGNITGDLVTAGIEGKSIGTKGLIIDAVSGAAGGAVGGAFNGKWGAKLADELVATRYPQKLWPVVRKVVRESTWALPGALPNFAVRKETAATFSELSGQGLGPSSQHGSGLRSSGINKGPALTYTAPISANPATNAGVLSSAAHLGPRDLNRSFKSQNFMNDPSQRSENTQSMASPHGFQTSATVAKITEGSGSIRSGRLALHAHSLLQAAASNDNDDTNEAQLKALSCHGGLTDARTLAETIQRQVFASYTLSKARMLNGQ